MRAIPEESWISQTQAEQTYSELKEKFSVLEERLARFNLGLPKNSRFATYRHTLERLSQFSTGGAVDLSRQDDDNIHDALLESEMFASSMAEATGMPEVVGWREVVLRTFADDREENTPGRDALFELFLAAQLRQAGFVVRLEEPDVTFELEDGTSIAIAAKRVKSADQVMKRIRKAGKQIEKCSRYGIAAIQPVWFSRQRTRASGMQGAFEILRSETQAYAVRKAGEFRKAVNAKKTIGLLLLSSRLVELDSAGPRAGLGIVLCYYLMNFCHIGDPRQRFLAQLNDGLERSSHLFVPQ